MRSLILSGLLAFFVSLSTYAQTPRDVKGIVADSSGLTIPGAIVKLSTGTDSTTLSTDANGGFVFHAVTAKQISITYTSIGYTGLKRRYVLDNDTKPVNIGMVKLSAESKMLNAVNVTDVQAVKIKEDTTEYKASAYPVRANAPVEDVLKKLPGVDVDANGNVTAQGKQVTKVRINGKDFFGGDVQTATKNLPADVIESIQMVDDYGDQANLTGIKSGEPNKVMNIVIRKDKNYGYSLSATGGDGNDALPQTTPSVPQANRYIGATNSFSFNGDQQVALLGSINNTNVNVFSFGGAGGGGRRFSNGSAPNGITDAKSLGLNFRDQWGKYLSVYGSYSFTDNSTNTISTTTTNYNTNNSGQLINNANSNYIDGTLNHRLTWNMEYKPDTLNYLKFTPTYSYSSSTNNDLDFNNETSSGSPILSYKTNTIGNTSAPSYGATVLYNHRFNGKGRNFSISVSANNGPSSQYSNPSTLYTVGAPPTLTTPLDQLINIRTRSNSENVSLSYIEPLSHVLYLEANYAYNRSFTGTDKETDSISRANSAIINNDAVLSNNYTSTFTTNRFGLNYRLIESKYNLTLGGVAQPTSLNGFAPANSKYSSVVTTVNTFNIIPVARFVYNFSRTQALTLNYNGSSNQPTYAELNPRPDSSNVSAPVVGNPGLQPEFNNNFSLRYNKFSFGTGNILFANLSFTQTNNKIVTNVTTTQTTVGGKPSLVQAISYLNTDGYYAANGFFTFAKPWDKRKYTLILNGNVNYTNNIGYSNNIENIAKQLTFTPGVRFRFDIPDVVDAQASTSYGVTQTNNSADWAQRQNGTVKTINLGLNGKNYLWTNWTVSYDFTKTLNQGYTYAVTNPNVLNAYVERRFLKNNMATVRAAVYDVFNQNTGYTYSATSNSTVESSVNRLGRYFLLTLTIRLQKFAGKSPEMDMPGQRGHRMMGGDGGGHGPGGGFGGPNAD